jgi:NADH:ubiquinone reductase (H+-translocating)
MKQRILIVGAGFGGLALATSLSKADVEVVVIDRTNHHLFQPLLYQVATAALSPGDIAVPIRSILARQANVTVVMGEVTGIDRASKTLTLSDQRTFTYDDLVVATGSRHHYFGQDAWEAHSTGLKTLADALSIREQLLQSFEKAESLPAEEAIPYLNFVIVGGGPTGVELAGAISEISRKTMLGDFRRIKPGMVHVYLIEAMPAVLGTYSPKLSESARSALEQIGVNVLTNTRVLQVDGYGVTTTNGMIPSRTIIWAAGNQASPVVRMLDVETDRIGRAIVGPQLHLSDDEHVFVIGDAAHVPFGTTTVPGVAQGAMQMGRYVARVLRARLTGRSQPAAFRYRDLGNMATIGRAKAIADIQGLEFSGTVAWLLWSVIHVAQLISFRNRFRVMAEWFWYYVTFKGGFRLITGVRRSGVGV